MTDTLYHNVNYNDGGEDPIGGPQAVVEQRMELLKYRYFVKTPKAQECRPYDYYVVASYRRRLAP